MLISQIRARIVICAAPVGPGDVLDRLAQPHSPKPDLIADAGRMLLARAAMAL
jgi:hypothetical protein